MKRRVGDRRTGARFEILGDLWGYLETTVSMLVENICREGALLDSPVPLEHGSSHWVTAFVDGQPYPVQFRVCHSRPRSTDPGASRYWIGIEFLRLPPEVDAELQRITAQNNGVSPEACDDRRVTGTTP